MSGGGQTAAPRTALVTGATTGIGRATALALAARRFRVYVVGRDPARTADAAAAAPGAVGFVADLSRQAEVRRLAAEVRARLAEDGARLDVLVNNAGALFDSRRTSADGIELTFALNHLAYFLLTAELLPELRAAGAATGDARVVVVASDAHQGARRLALDDLQSERGYSAVGAYAQSKLANVMFAYALARRLAGTGVAANALHPGVIGSNFAAGQGGTWGLFFKLARPFLASPESGARTSVFLAADGGIRGATGGYYKRERPARSSAASYDEAAQEALWAASERLTAARPRPA